MTSKETLLFYAEEWMKYNPKSKKPEYLIYTVVHPYRKGEFYVPWLGRMVVFTEPGVVEDASFYGVHRDLDKAVSFLNENRMAVQDGCFFGAFILLRFPDIPPFNTVDTRMFFCWDEEKRGFFQEEEPDFFRDVPVYPGAFSCK